MTGTAAPQREKIVLVVIAFAVFMATLDTSIVNIALPVIASAFGTDLGLVSWVVMAYLIVLSGLMLAFGRLGDMSGFRRVFISGLAIFTLGSLLCGLAAGIGSLVAFRIVQGIGAAAIEAIAPAMIVLYLPEEKRGWALGILMTIVSVAIAAGPILGGYITETFGWNWIFFINVPVGIVAVALSARYLPGDFPTASAARFDTAGAVMILIALAAFLFPLNQGLYLGWTSPLILGSFTVSLIVGVLFLLHERRCGDPLIDLHLFDSKNYFRGNVAGMLILMAFAGSEFLLPFYFERVRGDSPEITGLLLAVPAVALMASGPVAGRLSDRYGSRGLMIVSSLIAAGTMYLYALFGAATGLPLTIAALAIEGIAVGLFVPPNMNLILGSGNREGGGVASSVMMTIRNIGNVLGVAVFGTIAVEIILLGMGSRYNGLPAPDELVPGFHVAFLAGMVICLGAAAVSVTVVGQKEQAPGPVQGENLLKISTR